MCVPRALRSPAGWWRTLTVIAAETSYVGSEGPIIPEYSIPLTPPYYSKSNAISKSTSPYHRQRADTFPLSGQGAIIPEYSIPLNPPIIPKAIECYNPPVPKPV